MARKIKLNDFGKEVSKILQTYGDDVIKETKEVVDEVTDEALKEVKDHAPIDERSTNRRGKYKKSIRSTTVFESITEKRNVIHATKGEHRLTHLLEKGHAKVNGGRTKAIPHFYYGEKLAQKELPIRIEKKIGGK